MDAKPIYHPDRPGEQVKYCLDGAKAKAVLGWVPRVDLRTGLEQTIRASSLPIG